MGSPKENKAIEQIIMENKDLRATVLIVDDNIDLAEITRANLERFTHFKTLTACNGREALEVLNHDAVDVIILDEHMPEMSGAEFFRTIRQRSIYVPVIFLTGQPDAEVRQQQLNLGAFDYLEKPIKARDLILLVVEASKVMHRIHAILERRA